MFIELFLLIFVYGALAGFLSGLIVMRSIMVFWFNNIDDEEEDDYGREKDYYGREKEDTERDQSREKEDT